MANPKFHKDHLQARDFHTFLFKSTKMESKDTREKLLAETYKLLLTSNWETVTIESIEKSIGRTRGSIFYSFKNKLALFLEVIEKMFVPDFVMTNEYKKRLSNITSLEILLYYKTPFELIIDTIYAKYKFQITIHDVLNIMLQSAKFFPTCWQQISRAVSEEIVFVEGLFEKCPCCVKIDLNFYNLFFLRTGMVFIETFKQCDMGTD